MADGRAERLLSGVALGACVKEPRAVERAVGRMTLACCVVAQIPGRRPGGAGGACEPAGCGAAGAASAARPLMAAPARPI